MKKWGLLVGMIAIAGVIAIVLINPFSGPRDAEEMARISGPEPGNLAPLFTLTSFDGEKISLEDFRGKPVIVKFWASHCGACNLTAPALTDFYRDHEEDLSIIAVNIDTSETREAIDEYLEKYEITYFAGMDETGEIVQDYRVTKTSTYFFINAEGIITQKHSLVILDKSLFELGYEKALASTL